MFRLLRLEFDPLAELFFAELFLRVALFMGAEFAGAAFMGAEFAGAAFMGAKFAGAAFMGAKFAGAEFVGAAFIGVPFVGAAPVAFLGVLLSAMVLFLGFVTGEVGVAPPVFENPSSSSPPNSSAGLVALPLALGARGMLKVGVADRPEPSVPLVVVGIGCSGAEFRVLPNSVADATFAPEALLTIRGVMRIMSSVRWDVVLLERNNAPIMGSLPRKGILSCVLVLLV